MQLQPHFLFNTLGAIMVLIQQQKTAQAEAMVEKLGNLLRLTLDDVEAQEVPLWRELEFLRLYLSIEQVRFEDRLRVRIAPPPRCPKYSCHIWCCSRSLRTRFAMVLVRARRR